MFVEASFEIKVMGCSGFLFYIIVYYHKLYYCSLATSDVL